MSREPRLLGLVRVESVTRVLFLLLLIALLLVADGYVLILLSRHLGIYLLLAIEAATGIIGVLVVLSSYRRTLTGIHQAVREHRYPAAEFRLIVCYAAGAVLLIVPGFVTDALGLVALLPPGRWLLGFAIERKLRGRFEEVYEYLRLEV